MGYKDRALSAPQAAIDDPQSSELIRAWVAAKELQCSIRLGVWDDPGAWGKVLADVARQIAAGVEARDEIPRQQTLDRMVKIFVNEFTSSGPAGSEAGRGG